MNRMNQFFVANRVVSLLLLIGLCASLPMMASAQDAKTDLFLFSQQWKQTAGDDPLGSDLNADGVVDALDLLLLIQPPVVVVPTPTPTIPDVTPEFTPTPTIPDVTPEFTPTPTIPDATPTATPTVTPSVTPTPTPTLVAGFVEFCADFDQADSLAEAGFVTLSEDTITPEQREALIDEGRLEGSNTLVPWFIYDEANPPANGTGVAESGTRSAAFNSDFGGYTFLQTSILTIDQAFFTEGAITPRLRFAVAYNLEVIDSFSSFVRDYLAVEVLRDGADSWELLDINRDGVVTSETFQLGDGSAFSEGSFDAIFGSQLDFFGNLEKDNYITVEIDLPKDPALQVSFRFVSDNSIQEQGAFIDTLCVFDAGAVSGDPVLTSAAPALTDAVYADANTLLALEGTGLSPVGSVILNVEGDEQSISFVDSANGITALVPRFADATSEVTASLRVVRTDGVESNLVEIAVVPAPVPEITSVEPAQFPILGGDTALTISGLHFRPSLDQGSEVVISQLGTELTFTDDVDFISRGINEIVVDARGLQEGDFTPGPLQLVVRNTFSGLESEPFIFEIAENLDVLFFDVEVGGIGGVTYDPAIESFPLQTDHAFALIWEGENFSQSSLSIFINGATIAVDSQIDESLQSADPLVDPATVDLFIGGSGFGQRVILSISPNVLSAGEQTVVIRNGATGAAFEGTFTIIDPLPPILYGPNPSLDDQQGIVDWATGTLSADAANSIIFVVGDNFRGLSNEASAPETDSQVFLIPTDDGDPILLTDIQPSIAPPFTGNDFDRDILDVFIPAGSVVVPEGEIRTYRIQVVNPDSGLSITSAEDRVLTFTP